MKTAEEPTTNPKFYIERIDSCLRLLREAKTGGLPEKLHPKWQVLVDSFLDERNCWSKQLSAATAPSA